MGVAGQNQVDAGPACGLQHVRRVGQEHQRLAPVALGGWDAGQRLVQVIETCVRVVHARDADAPAAVPDHFARIDQEADPCPGQVARQG